MTANKSLGYLRTRCEIDPETGCWRWVGPVTPQGYARVHLGDKRVAGHRLAYELHRGEIPAGLFITHTCKVMDCINPEHLEAVTKRESMARSDHPGAAALRGKCQRGHIVDISGESARCLQCYRDSIAAHRKPPKPQPTLRERIEENIARTPSCWIWTGYTSNGYGRLRVGRGIRTVTRLVWELEHGPIPDDLQIDHLCRNSYCVRIDHLEPVTQWENIARGTVSGAATMRKDPRYVGPSKVVI